MIVVGPTVFPTRPLFELFKGITYVPDDLRRLRSHCLLFQPLSLLRQLRYAPEGITRYLNASFENLICGTYMAGVRASTVVRSSSSLYRTLPSFVHPQFQPSSLWIIPLLPLIVCLSEKWQDRALLRPRIGFRLLPGDTLHFFIESWRDCDGHVAVPVLSSNFRHSPVIALMGLNSCIRPIGGSLPP
ncbi:hypothetical protein CPB85DRAFT_1308320 [Mucidula mucida]|nr:hypothetical protein CPB85DRAFT_1308320 [Mucidula mucida]